MLANKNDNPSHLLLNHVEKTTAGVEASIPGYHLRFFISHECNDVVVSPSVIDPSITKKEFPSKP